MLNNYPIFACMNNRAYLGTGLKYPLTLQRGKATTENGLLLLNQSIKIILDTPIGTRLFLPEFGSRLSELLFEPNDDVLHDLLQVFITEALRVWERRLKVVRTTFENIDDRVDCTIHYRVLNSNETDSFVYPFYRKIKY